MPLQRIDPDSWSRIAELVRRDDHRPKNGPGKAPTSTPVITGDCALVRVTSLTLVDDLYPGKIIQLDDPVAGTYTDYGDCWIEELNDGTLEETRYLARRCAFENDRLVYVVDLGGGGGGVETQFVLISSYRGAFTDFFIWDGYIVAPDPGTGGISTGGAESIYIAQRTNATVEPSALLQVGHVYLAGLLGDANFASHGTQRVFCVGDSIPSSSGITVIGPDATEYDGVKQITINAPLTVSGTSPNLTIGLETLDITCSGDSIVASWG